MKYLNWIKSLKGWLANMSQNMRDICIVIAVSIICETITFFVGKFEKRIMELDDDEWAPSHIMMIPLGIWDVFVIVVLAYVLYH